MILTILLILIAVWIASGAWAGNGLYNSIIKYTRDGANVSSTEDLRIFPHSMRRNRYVLWGCVWGLIAASMVMFLHYCERNSTYEKETR